LRIGLIDYGMGNLHSVQTSFQRLDVSLNTVQTPDHLQRCDALILPGVGAFDPAMEQLEATGLVPQLKLWGKQDRPLLGICLGLQLLFDSSEEGQREGLGLLSGRVTRLPDDAGERIPHMGWARLQRLHPCPVLHRDDPEAWMYFVHSYAAYPNNTSVRAATAPFGGSDATAIVWQGRIGACQFHPEKSGRAGQRLLQHWLSWLQHGAPPAGTSA
jgi:glutamine amidotransferase